MKNITKVVSVFLASIMLASFALTLGGCNSSKKEERPEFITEDQPWFDSNRFELTIPYDESDFEYCNLTEPAYVDGYIYTVFQGYKYYRFDEEEYDSDNTTIKSILQYDLNGNLVSELSFSDIPYKVGYCSNFSADGDKLRLTCDAYDEDERCYITTQFLMDPKTNTFEKAPVDIDITTMDTIQAEYQVGDSRVYLVTDYSGSGYRFIISGDKTKTVSIGATVEDLYFVDSCIVIDDSTLLAFCYAKESTAIELDVNNGEIRKVKVDIDKSRYSFVPVQDGKAYAANCEGIFTINDKLEVESVMDYDSALVNLSDLNYATPLYVDDDLIVVSTFRFSGNNHERFVYTFKRASSNPNVGKKIIDVFSMSPYVSYAEAEAILKFNQTSSDYFATLRVADNSFDYSDEVEANKAYAQVSDQLMVDIMAGDGPDIVLNGFDYSEFNNPEYFLDFNKLIAEDASFDMNKYYSNIFEASEWDDGALYQLPASFVFDCIVSRVSDVGEGHIGFTFDDYEKFLSGACNGVSPIDGSRDQYLDLCVSSGYFSFLKDGKVDFNSEEFKQACDFAKRNFPEDPSDHFSEIIISSSVGSLNGPMRLDAMEPDFVVASLAGTSETVGFYGFPAAEEHGPTAVIMSSAAISAGVDEKTKSACWDLVKFMLDDEVQNTINDSYPMNKEALSNILTSIADEADKSYDAYVRLGYNEEEIIQFQVRKVNRDIIDSLCDAVLNITDVYRSDSSIAIIISEEMPAYFAGQKDIDDVISIINVRAQTLIDERGLND